MRARPKTLYSSPLPLDQCWELLPNLLCLPDIRDGGTRGSQCGGTALLPKAHLPGLCSIPDQVGGQRASGLCGLQNLIVRSSCIAGNGKKERDKKKGVLAQGPQITGQWPHFLHGPRLSKISCATLLEMSSTDVGKGFRVFLSLFLFCRPRRRYHMYV